MVTPQAAGANGASSTRRARHTTFANRATWKYGVVAYATTSVSFLGNNSTMFQIRAMVTHGVAPMAKKVAAKLRVCSACGVDRYCGDECQLADHRRHRQWCKVWRQSSEVPCVFDHRLPLAMELSLTDINCLPPIVPEAIVMQHVVRGFMLKTKE